MKKIVLQSAFCILHFSLFAQVDYTKYVDPFIGTGGHGHTFPGATVPFGMVQLSPDTRDDGSWDGCGGYHYSDSLIFGFSHTHLSGTGCSDYGDILLMPVRDSVDLKKKYSARFSHKNEKASPGFYSVKMDNGILAEFSSTARAGIHRYIFPPDAKPGLVIDLMHRDKVLDASLKFVSDKIIEGYRISEAWAKEQHVYFRIEFSVPYELEAMLCDSAKEDATAPGIKELKGKTRAWLKFNMPPGVPLQIKVSISGVDEEGAQKNMQAEIPTWDFEKVEADAVAFWNRELSKIEVSGGSTEQLKNFYTALYHCMIQPNIYNDVDHRYRGRDNQIHTATGFDYYTVFSLWDTFRAWHPLMTIIDRKRTADYIKTFLAQYEQGGLLPVWELSSNETECMIGYHSVSVLADAASKGITDYNLEKLFEAMKKSAESANRFGLGAYMEKGFLEADDEHESVSKTLEYCYDDWCIARVAKLLNRESDYMRYMTRSQGWKNLFDPEKRFIRPRKNGGWYEPFDPREVNNNYTEANAWQYNFFVPQDVAGLVEATGGVDWFDMKLDMLFASTSETTGREQSDITGMIGQYAHGNEPSHHMTYLYCYINKPWKTEQLVHRILTDFYKNSPDGLIGNEDCGQMSAWYVLSALGMYQVCPGNAEFMLAAPLFPESKIKVGAAGGTEIFFSVKAEKVSEKNIFVNGRKLNGAEYKNRMLSYSDIIKGGELTASMSYQPDYSVYVDAGSASTVSTMESIVPAPVIEADKNVFRDTMSVEIKNLSRAGKIYYTSDGSVPEMNSKFEIRNSKFIIDNTCVIKAIVFNDRGTRSSIVSAHFYKLPHPDWKISLTSKYSQQYTGGGDEGIIDGLRGTTDWRKGYWQGYQSQDFECVIDLGAEKEITKLSAGFLQDVGAWIMFPKKVEFEISRDEKKYSKAATIENKIPDSDLKVQLKDFTQSISKQKARYIKVKVKNYGKLPSWHQGAGGDVWIFVDEITVE
jgi:predicted alpha-1,2-mannosidase